MTADAHSEAGPPRTAAQASVSVLVVDDDPVQRALLEAFFNEQGYPVTTASDGNTALELIRRSFYPVVVTDWMMPGLDGIDLCRRLRQGNQPGYIYVIFTTTRDSSADVIKGMEAGADDYVVKPVDPWMLKARMLAARRIIALERALTEQNEELQRVSYIDPLTRLFNRRYLNENLPPEIKRSHRYRRPLSLLLGDVDRFKQVNDVHGHAAGDEVLRAVCSTLSRTLREDVDWAVRYGGDEVLVVLPEVGLDGALVAAERYRVAMEQQVVSAPTGDLSVTCSIGAAAYLGGDEAPSMEQLINRADEMLYRAKEEGRNRAEGAVLGEGMRG